MVKLNGEIPERPTDEESPPDAKAIHEECVVAASTAVAASAVDWARSQEAAKSAKKEFDGAVEKLREIIARGPEAMPLFDGQAEDDQDKEDDEDDIASSPDAWREVSINELGLSEAILEKFDEIDVATVGELEDLRAEISQGKSSWPKGVGPAKVTIIEDAVLSWLSLHQAVEQEKTGDDDETEVADGVEE